MARAERRSRRAAGHGLQNRRLHFGETAIFQEPADFAHHQDAFLKCFPRLLVRNQIDITLPIARFDVLQAVPFFRRRTERLGQDFKFVRFQRRLTGLG